MEKKPTMAQRLRDAGLIPKEAARRFTEKEIETLEDAISENDLKALIRVRKKLGEDFFRYKSGPSEGALKHFIFF